MFTATASALPQTPASLLEGNRPGPLSLAVAPQETRPIEKGDRSGSTASRERHDPGAAPTTDAETKAGQQAPELPVRAPDDPAAQRRGRNLNLVFDAKSGRPIIEIINPRTGDVMDRIPPESLAERAQKEKIPARANLVDKTA